MVVHCDATGGAVRHGMACCGMVSWTVHYDMRAPAFGTPTPALYAAALEQAAGGEAVADAVLGDVTRAAADVGIEPGSPEASELARRLAEVELGR